MNKTPLKKVVRELSEKFDLFDRVRSIEIYGDSEMPVGNRDIPRAILNPTQACHYLNDYLNDYRGHPQTLLWECV